MSSRKRQKRRSPKQRGGLLRGARSVRAVQTAVARPALRLEPPPELAHFIPSLVRAAGAEPREVASLRGSSGVEHAFRGVGIDEQRRRIILVPDAPEARGPALAQADVQAALPDRHVIVVRPVFFSVRRAAQLVVEGVGRSTITTDWLTSMPSAERGASVEEVQAAWTPIMGTSFKTVYEWIQNARGIGAFNWRPHVAEILEQLTHVRIRQDGPENFALELADLVTPRAAENDLQLGVCGVPVYAMTDEELETINLGVDGDAIERILSTHGVMQYFFPPASALPSSCRVGHNAHGCTTAVLKRVFTPLGRRRPTASVSLARRSS
jgi:hypothetical protein